MKNTYIILFCLVALVASTQTDGLLRSIIELSAFIGIVWWVFHKQTSKVSGMPIKADKSKSDNVDE